MPPRYVERNNRLNPASTAILMVLKFPSITLSTALLAPILTRGLNTDSRWLSVGQIHSMTFAHLGSKFPSDAKDKKNKPDCQHCCIHSPRSSGLRFVFVAARIVRGWHRRASQFLADRFDAEAVLLKDLGCHALLFAKDSQQEMLGRDMLVHQTLRLFGCIGQNAFALI